MTYEEIAIELGISVSEVRKIEAQALKKLKMPTEINKKFYRYLRGML
jgi:DNA-directed RNA polymerase sigma subunit (sigma70/sigma32)